MGSKSNKLGEINNNTHDTKMKIIKYNNSHDIIVEFQDKFKSKVKTTYQSFKKGEVTNPYDKDIFGIGYLGVGKYKSKNKRKIAKNYNTWRKMIQRCYDPKYHKKERTYVNCDVCNEWLNFQNFAKWYENNYYEIEGEKTHLDKDILIKGNKIYSPDTCVFVPQRINNLFTKCDASRGDLPIGVNKRRDRFISRCWGMGKGKYKSIWLGSFDTPEQAFEVYKQFKENYIKQVADEYKDKIPKKLYDAMYKYEVEITD